LLDLQSHYQGLIAGPNLMTRTDDLETDSLTGLLSRKGLQDFLAKYTLGQDGRLTLLTVQMARFGNVNSSMGGALGDKIITLAAKRLYKTFPNALALARTHGDHFCLLLDAQTDVGTELEMLQDFTQRPFAVRGEVIVLNVRVGIASIGETLPSPSLLLQASEVALQDAKRSKVKTSFFNNEMVNTAIRIHQLENDLRLSLANRHAEIHRALNNDEFFLQYQPIIDAGTNQISAFEALLRWQHPEKGIIHPSTFIPVAEQIQVMDELGSWVIRRAVSDAQSWPPRPDGQPIAVSINVSSTQFIEPKILLAAVSNALQETGISPGLVHLEITESVDFAAAMTETLKDLRALGCRIALDDFGTGFSSLTQLNQLPLDWLKLDRGFISDLDSDDIPKVQRSLRMTQAILSLAEAFKLVAVIEGIETRRQLDTVTALGANLVQGYYYSRPMPSEQVAGYIRSFGAKKG
jgi:diguanylate cyclase (GGDEF)-like protein